MASRTSILLLSLFQPMITSSFGHPDGEHTVTPILDVVPPVLDENVVAIPLLEIHVIELSSDTSLHSVSDSFEYVTYAALQTTGLQLFATDSDGNTIMSATLSPARDPSPPHDPEPAPKLAPVPLRSA
ncbi:hypothetical protein Hanom_Chr04g00293961 [Helianthus anomalus]